VSERPYRLVPASALEAVAEAASQALDQWCADWGASRAELTVDVSRLDECVLPAPPDAWRPLRGGWSFMGSNLAGHVAAAMGLPSPAPSDPPSLSAQTVARAADGLSMQLSGLLRDPRELASPPTLADLPPPGSKPGHGLIIVNVKRGPSTLALVADATAFKSYAPAVTQAVAPKAAELDAALRTQAASLEVILGHTELSLADMMDLGPGDVLLLDRHIHEPLTLVATAGHAELPVHLGRQGEHFAVQLMRPHQP